MNFSRPAMERKKIENDTFINYWMHTQAGMTNEPLGVGQRTDNFIFIMYIFKESISGSQSHVFIAYHAAVYWHARG